MVLLRYLLVLVGAALLVGAAGILLWDIYQVVKWRKQPEGEERPPALRLQTSNRLAAMAMIPLLYGLSIQLPLSGSAGARTNLFGTRLGSLRPVIEQVEFLDTRDIVFLTAPHLKPEARKPNLVAAAPDSLKARLLSFFA